MSERARSTTENPALRSVFDAASRLTVGLEEEVMVLDPDTLGLAPRAEAVVAALTDAGRWKLELPASQVEIATGAHADVGGAISELAAGRAALLSATGGTARFACAGAHPFSPVEGELLTTDPRRAAMASSYGIIARRQLICALQVQVAIGDADAAIAVHDSLRSYLPWLAALAANAPFHAGGDTGLASIRPAVAGQLPRQGIPPALGSFESFERSLEWGREVKAFPGAEGWWWELRPNARFGTLELRVPDAQVTLDDALAVAAVGHGLVSWLLARHESGERPPVHERWQLEENRWLAMRHGLDAELIDLDSGARVPARDGLVTLLDELAKARTGGGSDSGLRLARELLEAGGGAGRQRRAAGAKGARGAVRWLSEQFELPLGA